MVELHDERVKSWVKTGMTPKTSITFYEQINPGICGGDACSDQSNTD